jgi:hypothetical protein
MAHTVLSSDTLTDPTRRAALLDAVDRAVTVDRSFDVLGLASQLPAISSGTIGFHTIPVVDASYRTPQDGDAVQVDPAAVQRFVADTIAGSAPAAPVPAPAATGSSATPAAPTTPATPAALTPPAAVPCVH